ncbi:MAG TPA: hypothetical protein VLV45_11945 [Gemmatimonadales bacterium]|nr:hypothetical protein [Gemmatimonadales bacterium]
MGVQTLGRWEWYGRITFEPDSQLTIMRLGIDTAPRPSGAQADAHEDVVLIRYDFDPSPALGDEYALTLGLSLRRARDLKPGVAYSLGGDGAPIPAHATVTCLCAPLREDSVRGALTLATRGMRQLTGRVDAVVYFTEWNDGSRHRTYFVHQRFDAIK